MRKCLWSMVLIVLISVGCAQSTSMTVEGVAKVQEQIVLPVVPEAAEISVVSILKSTPDLPENPYVGRIWNQHCDLIREEGVVVDIRCDEPWASEPLPGGCEEAETLDFKGYSGCSAAALAFVINNLLTPQEIERIAGTGVGGVTPSYLIDEIYPLTGLKLSCSGASVPTIRDTLTLFGLKTRSASVSKESLERSLLPGETAIVGLKLKYKGVWWEHWSVPVGFRDGQIYFADSFVGEGSTISLYEAEGVSYWEITSILYVSRTSP